MSTPMEVPAAELTTLADRANEEHRAAQRAARSALEHGRAAGEALNEAKAAVEHGSWGDWLAANFEASPRTARLYMRIARRWDELEGQIGNALPIREAGRLLREGSSEADDGGGESWLLEEGQAALVTTPQGFDETAVVTPSDAPGFFWVAVFGEASASWTRRPIHGDHLVVQLEACGFPAAYGTWKPWGEMEPRDYCWPLFEDRKEQFAEEIKRWKEPDDFQARADRRRRAARKGYDY